MEKRPPSKELALIEHTIIEPAYGGIKTLLADKKSLVHEVGFNELVKGFGTPDQLDPRQAVEQFMASPMIAALFDADIGLLRPTTLQRHTEADLGGFERDYRNLFIDDPEALKILRLTSLLKDSGKSLCVKETGDNREQTKVSGQQLCLFLQFHSSRQKKQ